MVYAFLEGRLGNNLWQIGAAATLAEQLNEPFRAILSNTYWCPEPDNCSLADYIRPFQKTIFRNVQFVDSLPSDTVHVDYGYQEQPFTKSAENICLHCCYPNMDTISVPLVQRLFEPTAEQQETLYKNYPVLKHPRTCCIVVRRGDYLHLPITNPAEDYLYYHKCMRRLEKQLHTKDIQYIIVSDDVDWCKKHFRKDNMFVVDNHEPLVDLYLISLCCFNILSNSTFALWGGVLNMFNNKIIFYPRPWVGIGMRKQKQYIPAMPESWIAVRHYSAHYLQGVVLWLWQGIRKKIKSIFRV